MKNLIQRAETRMQQNRCYYNLLISVGVLFINGCELPDAPIPTPLDNPVLIEVPIPPNHMAEGVSLLPFERYYTETLLSKIQHYRFAENVLMREVVRKLHESDNFSKGFTEEDTTFVEHALTTFFDAKDAVDAEKETMYAQAVQHYHQWIKTQQVTGERASLPALKQAAHNIALFQTIPLKIEELRVPELIKFIEEYSVAPLNLQTKVFKYLHRNPRLKTILETRQTNPVDPGPNYNEYQQILSELRKDDWFDQVINHQLSAELSHRWGINFQAFATFDYVRVTPAFKEIYDAVLSSLQSAKIMPGGGAYHLSTNNTPIPDTFSQMEALPERKNYERFVFRLSDIIRRTIQKGLYEETINNISQYGFDINRKVFLFHSDVIKTAYQKTKEALLARKRESLQLDYGYYDDELTQELEKIKRELRLPEVKENSLFYVVSDRVKPMLFNVATGKYEIPTETQEERIHLLFDGDLIGGQFFNKFLDNVTYKAIVKPLILRPEFAGIFDFLKTRDGFNDDADFMKVFSTATLEASRAVKSLSAGITPRIVRRSPGTVDLSHINIQGIHGGRSSIPLPVSAAITGDINASKHTHNLCGTAIVHLPHSYIGIHQAFANWDQGFTSGAQHTESSFSVCHSWHSMFLEVQSGWIQAEKLNSGNWTGYRHQCTLGYDADYISSFIAVEYRHLGRPQDDAVQHTAGYIGLEVAVLDMRIDGGTVNTQITAKIGAEVRQCKDVEDRSLTGMMEWSSAFKLDNGFAVHGNFVINPIHDNRSINVQVSFTH